ncbi:glycoside hydrolase [Corynebacterium sp. HMSC071F07]|uniref:C40 family peptidase n=1 Tax=Corynebacterium sp. HMSC071F07 TaxID=1715203 RepID=UPI0008A5BDEF|nr:C40 family peptidase [Corynebacterium sp. HMSC071F07]OFM00084.1 glycoside hydrolase [Corynebacterium sp. HMSC071F07]
MIEAAVKQISQMAPPALPAVDLPKVPDLETVPALAEIAHGDPSKLLDAANVLKKDRTTIENAVSQAQQLIKAAGRDLIGIGISLLTKAAPVALGMLVPNPAINAAARAHIQGLIASHLAQAFARLKQLLSELLAAAQPLLPIARRAVEKTVIGRSSEPAEPQIALGNGEKPSEVKPVAGLSSTVAAGSSSAGEGSSQGKAAVAAAMSKLGTPYVWGGTGNGGFDCSGLTQWAWRQAGVEIPRTAEAQTVGKQVSANELQPGDLVVWDGHVAMYKGSGEMIEAGSPVETSPLRTSNMGMAFKGFWRPTG